MAGLRIVSQPTIEPITLEQAKLRLRIDTDAEDDDILRLVATGRAYAEHFTGLSLATRTFEWRLAGFADVIFLPRTPVRSLDSITYYDADGLEQTLDSAIYSYDDDPVAPAIRLAPSQEWPDVSDTVQDPVRIRFTAGYDLPGESPQTNPLPPDIETAILAVAGQHYTHREAVTDVALMEVPMGVKALLRPYRVLLGMA